MGLFARAAAGEDVDVTAHAALRPMVGCEQTCAFHAEGDVSAHTALVVAEANKLLDDGTPGDQDAMILRLAALLHDVGKPTTTREVSPGCFASPGHANEGARVVSLLWATDPDLQALGLTAGAAVHALVRDHMWTYAPDAISVGAAVRMAHLVDPQLLRALWLADTRGRRCDDPDELADRVAYAWLVLEELGATTRDAFPHVSDVCDPTTLEPRVRREALRAVVEGVITDPGSASAFVAGRERAGRGGSLTYTIGLPGSGKSTWAASWRERTDGVVLSADGQRRRDRQRAHGHNRARLVELLRSGANVCVDATHVERSSRDRLLATAFGFGVPVTAVYVDTPFDTCVARQRTRPWRDAVPEAVLRKMRRELRWPTPDEYDTLAIV